MVAQLAGEVLGEKVADDDSPGAIFEVATFAGAGGCRDMPRAHHTPFESAGIEFMVWH
ncbi:hypothetical protein ABFA25_12990 [Mycobacterium lepromatosis]|uniref:Uncharacterized protein n=2 Tax=Mycobacterium lepromatosis TaxID=480418 RepID=A0A0F4EQ01_9MYCO|nr:hypothetical protein MLPM_1763 [Mycobacterium lepromatosis]